MVTPRQIGVLWVACLWHAFSTQLTCGRDRFLKPVAVKSVSQLFRGPAPRAHPSTGSQSGSAAPGRAVNGLWAFFLIMSCPGNNGAKHTTQGDPTTGSVQNFISIQCISIVFICVTQSAHLYRPATGPSRAEGHRPSSLVASSIEGNTTPLRLIISPTFRDGGSCPRVGIPTVPYRVSDPHPTATTVTVSFRRVSVDPPARWLAWPLRRHQLRSVAAGGGTA